MIKHKVAFIGDESIHACFTRMEDSWDFQFPIPTCSDLDMEIQNENSKLDADTSVVIFFSRLWKKEPEKFAELVAYFAPYSVTCILIPERDLSQKAQIEQSIKSAQQTANSMNVDYQINSPFYFVSYENPQKEIYEAIQNFCNNEIVDVEIRDAVSTMLPDVNLPIDEQFEEIGDYEEEDSIVELPAKREDMKCGEIIAVTSSKGGSGKSTTALLLASMIGKASKDSVVKGLEVEPLKVCVVDMDTRDGQIGFLINELKVNVITILANGTPPTPETIRTGIVHREKMGGVDFILAPKRPRNAKEIPPEFYAQLIDNLRYMYDYVILDTSVNYLDTLLEQVVYPMSDKVILVSDSVITSVGGMKRWIDENTKYVNPDTGQTTLKKEQIGIVMNQVLQDINMGIEEFKKAADGVEILEMLPSIPKLVRYAANTGEIDQVLNEETMNKKFKNLAKQIVGDKYKLGDVPYIKKTN